MPDSPSGASLYASGTGCGDGSAPTRLGSSPALMSSYRMQGSLPNSTASLPAPSTQNLSHMPASCGYLPPSGSQAPPSSTTLVQQLTGYGPYANPSRPCVQSTLSPSTTPATAGHLPTYGSVALPVSLGSTTLNATDLRPPTVYPNNLPPSGTIMLPTASSSDLSKETRFAPEKVILPGAPNPFQTTTFGDATSPKAQAMTPSLNSPKYDTRPLSSNTPSYPLPPPTIQSSAMSQPPYQTMPTMPSGVMTPPLSSPRYDTRPSVSNTPPYLLPPTIQSSAITRPPLQTMPSGVMTPPLSSPRYDTRPSVQTMPSGVMTPPLNSPRYDTRPSVSNTPPYPLPPTIQSSAMTRPPLQTMPMSPSGVMTPPLKSPRYGTPPSGSNTPPHPRLPPTIQSSAITRPGSQTMPLPMSGSMTPPLASPRNDMRHFNDVVTLCITQLLDVPIMEGWFSMLRKYRVRAYDQDEREISYTYEIDGLPAEETEGFLAETVPVGPREGILELETESPLLYLDLVHSGGLVPNTPIGRCQIHRSDPRSSQLWRYALSDKLNVPLGCGIELKLFEGPKEMVMPRPMGSGQSSMMFPGPAAGLRPELPYGPQMQPILTAGRLVPPPLSPPRGSCGQGLPLEQGNYGVEALLEIHQVKDLPYPKKANMTSVTVTVMSIEQGISKELQRAGPFDARAQSEKRNSLVDADCEGRLVSVKAPLQMGNEREVGILLSFSVSYASGPLSAGDLIGVTDPIMVTFRENRHTYCELRGENQRSVVGGIFLSHRLAREEEVRARKEGKAKVSLANQMFMQNQVRNGKAPPPFLPVKHCPPDPRMRVQLGFYDPSVHGKLGFYHVNPSYDPRADVWSGAADHRHLPNPALMNPNFFWQQRVKDDCIMS
eukprot:TRINITY_DN2770_c0_g1_i2.p1 TRINITY_DN2770_c0_g1~~TRINITY_DN2770_c0_g1_i2.p1  ORF type:complete len:883 (+),score=74.83 TRINITY_DN2770_c0_g1_i2:141-2789(+)